VIEVALTGNVASGKSSVARMWASRGIPVIEADQLAREVLAPGSNGLEAVRNAFGDGVLTREGALDREAMRDIVFRDPAARRRLESIVHPGVRELRQRWSEERRREGAPLVVSEIPLLFEAGLDGDFDVVVLVDAPEEERLRRLEEERGLGRAEARRVMDSQQDAREKREKADHVLENDGSLQELEIRASALLERLRKGIPGETE
jgi:dephospho-CoA kinase